LQHFYPSGVRNFLRVTPIDTHEMAADALLASRLHLRRVLVVADDATGGSAIHTPEFVRTARKLGLRTHTILWHVEKQPADVVVTAARRFGADGIFIAAGGPPSSAQLIRALRAALGDRVPIIATDYFESGNGVWQTAGGSVATNVYVSIIGEPNSRLPAAGRLFLKAFGPSTPSFGAAYAAQATDVLLAAIGRSDGSRASVLRQLYATDMPNGILGRIRFNRYGDLTYGPITILRLRRGPSPDGDPSLANTVIDRVITPPPGIVP
jgi:ABC-type branched-subunit amino acid transport system substrate-binding protein